MRTDLFGGTYDSPIFTCPTSGEKGLHPDGELAVARATKARGTLQMLSNSTFSGVEEVNSAHGQPVWFQLYAPTAWDACEKIVRRVEAAGCPVIALTVDSTTGRNSESYLRALRERSAEPADLPRQADWGRQSRAARCTTGST